MADGESRYPALVSAVVEARIRSAERAGRGIVTPEAVLLDFPLAGLGSRVMARLVDVACVGAMFYVLLIAIVTFGVEASPTLAIIIVVVSVFAVVFVYPTVMEAFGRGRTLGKRVLGLRVVTVAGGPVTLRAAATRAMLDLVDVYFSTGGIGMATMILSPSNQRLGDLAAGTIVIRERVGHTTTTPVHFAPPYGWEHYAAGLDVGSLTPAQYTLVRSFLLRVLTLAPEARWSLAESLGRRVAAAMNLTLPASVHPETFLVCVAAAYQRRHWPVRA